MTANHKAKLVGVFGCPVAQNSTGQNTFGA